MNEQRRDHARPVVRMVDVSKSFGGIRALSGVSFQVAQGEIHALLGENGAGKSTILKILRGVQPLDSGLIEVDGVALKDHTPESARAAGVAMIYQEMSLIPTLTVAQNIFLEREIRDRMGFIDDAEAVRRARALFDQFGVQIDPNALVSSLSAGQCQLTEIVKAASQAARVLILDEPTTALSDAEVGHLFEFLRRLKAKGVGIIYVSHRMDEIVQIADTATILRDGKHVLTAPLSELTLEKMIEHIVGRRSAGLSISARSEASGGEVLLELREASGAQKPRNVSLTVRSGEVVGVAGLLGSGRSALARLVCGIDPLVSGEIRVRGAAVKLKSPRDAIRQGIALVPENRAQQGVIGQHSVASNITLPLLDKLSHRYWLQQDRAERVVRKQIDDLRIKTASPEKAIRTLSGGNQQKAVLAKWLALNPNVLVLDEPTSGIDIGSKSEIVALIRTLAQQGKAILLISSELAELLAASDRVVIMSDGEMVNELSHAQLTDDEHEAGDGIERLQRAERRLQHAIQLAAQKQGEVNEQ